MSSLCIWFHRLMPKFLDEVGESLIIGRNPRQSFSVIERTGNISGLAAEIDECQ